MNVTILYDNVAQRGFHAGHGFACLVEGQKTILFDTGWDGHLLLANMVHLSITPAQIDAVMLSHSHWDHIGGLPTLLNHNKKLDIYYPRWFSQRLKREVAARARVKEIADAAQLAGGMYTTGELESEVKEQSLIVTDALAIQMVLSLFLHARILVEEHTCLERYGDAYRDYMQRVPRYFLFF